MGNARIIIGEIMNIKKILSILMILFLIGTTGMASAVIVEDLPCGYRNIVPEGAILIDFEDAPKYAEQVGDKSFNLWELHHYPGLSFEPMGDAAYWGYAEKGGRGMNIYPLEYYDEIDYTYLVHGEYGFVPVHHDDVFGQFWPAASGLLRIENGTNHISIMASIGSSLQMKCYDKIGKYLGSSGIAYTNTQRISPDGPSTFTQMSYTSTKSDIYCVEFIGRYNNWIGDDLVIGGMIDPEHEPDLTDYEYVADRAVELFGVPYLEFGLGFDYGDFTYMEVDQFESGQFMEYWNPDLKEIEMDVGISDEGLVLWSYNCEGEKLVKWSTSPNMMKHDFTEVVPFDDIQPGDVYFLDANSDGDADTIGMVITENTPGMDLITVNEFGVVLMNSDITESKQEFLGYYRLPDSIHGGHSPIKKIHIP